MKLKNIFRRRDGTSFFFIVYVYPIGVHSTFVIMKFSWPLFSKIILHITITVIV